MLWERYIQLMQIEAAFKALKSDLGLRPIYHQREHRVEAHICVAFLAYCLLVTLKNRLQALAPGLTPKAVLEKLAGIQMLDVYLPTTDGRYLIMPRYTQPEPDQAILLHKLQLSLPAQPPPRIKAKSSEFPSQASATDVVPTFPRLSLKTKDLTVGVILYCESQARQIPGISRPNTIAKLELCTRTRKRISKRSAPRRFQTPRAPEWRDRPIGLLVLRARVKIPQGETWANSLREPLYSIV